MSDTDRTPSGSKTVKRPRYEQKFKLEYSSEFKFISKLHAGESYAFCTLCRSDICIVHSGRGAYYFLLCLDPKLTNSCLAMLAVLYPSSSCGKQICCWDEQSL